MGRILLAWLIVADLFRETDMGYFVSIFLPKERNRMKTGKRGMKKMAAKRAVIERISRVDSKLNLALSPCPLFIPSGLPPNLCV
jgi:hypothetical protein